MDEITNLVNVLRPQVKNYKERQIRSAILAEGYSDDIANKVIAELFKEQKQENKDIIENKLPPENIKTNEKKDYYAEVDKLLLELRKINNIENNLEIPKKEFIKQDISNNPKRIIGNISNILEEKKKELDSIVIESGDDDKIILNDGKTINLNDYPRRDWRTYREQGKTLAQIKSEKKEALRKEIYELKRNNSNTNNNDEKKEDISDMIFNQLKERNVNVDDEKVKRVTRDESNKLREQYQEKQIEKKELDLAVDNIYKQLEQNPDAENNKLGEKKDIKKETKESNTDFNLGNDFNIDMNLDSNSENNAENEFDLGLDLNLNEKKKEKKK